jgi:hypothetical protein
VEETTVICNIALRIIMNKIKKGFMKRIIFLLILIFLTATCSDKEKQDELKNRIVELEMQLDDCQNGAEKLLARIKIAFDEERFTDVKTIYFDFQNRHPESPEFSDAKTIYYKAIKAEEEKIKETGRLAEKEKAKKLKALNKLKKDFDDVSGITWYKQPYFTHYTNTNLTSIYMGDDGTSRWLRLMMSYKGEDWIFFENAYLSYEGNTKQIIFNKYKDKEKENSGEGVWEWIDVVVTKDLEMFLRDFAKSKDAKMRLSGKYSKTRNLTNNERQGILDVLNGLDALENRIE